MVVQGIFDILVFLACKRVGERVLYKIVVTRVVRVRVLVPAAPQVSSLFARILFLGTTDIVQLRDKSPCRHQGCDGKRM